MTKITVTDTSGDKREIVAEEGESLMENIRANDFYDMAAICGGSCACCSCHIHVDTGWYDKLPAPKDDESSLLEESDEFITKQSRLACQVVVSENMEGLTVTIVSES